MKSFSFEEYSEHEDNYDGYCTKCGAIKYGGTEPDADGYECEECGAMAVVGISNALIMGLITIGEDD
jgi:hypothetical protein